MIHFVFCVALITQSPSKELTASDVTNAWESGCQSIISYDLNIIFEDYSYVRSNEKKEFYIVSDPSSVRPMVSKSRIYRSGEMRRGDFHLENATTNQSTLIINRDRCLILTRSSRNATIQQGLLCMGSMEYEDYESYFRSLIGSVDRIAEVRRRGHRLLPREGRLYVLDVDFAKDFHQAFFNFRWRIWLDPDRNFMPSRIVAWYDHQGSEQLDRKIENTLKEVAPGVWAPVSCRVDVYSKGEADNPRVGKCIGYSTVNVVDGSTFNGEVKADLFSVEIPDGFLVNDQIRNIAYTKGSSDPDRYLAQITKDASESVSKLRPEDRQPPATIFVPNSWWSRYRPWLSWTSAVILTLVATVLVRRSLARRKG